MEGNRRFEPGLVLAVLLVLASLAPTAATIHRAPAVDYYHFWLVGQIVHSGEARDVYGREARLELGETAYRRAFAPGGGKAQRRAATKFRRLETTATPFLYASFFPFVSGDYDRDRVVFNAASLLLFLFAAAAIAWRLGYGVTAVLVLLGLLLVAFEPLASDLRVGNVNRLQFGLLAFYAALLWRPAGRTAAGAAGAWIGLASMWKPNLAFVAATVSFFWWLRGDSARLWAHLAGAALGVLAAFGCAAAFFGTPEVWVWWLEAAARLTDDFPVSVADGNFAPSHVLEQFYGIRLGLAWPLAIVALLGMALRHAAHRSGPGEHEGEILPLVGIGVAASLLASPLAWLHYYLLSVFLVLWALRPDGAERVVPWAQRMVAVAAVVAVSMGPVLQLFVTSAPGLWAGFGNGGLVLLLVLGLVDLGRMGRGGVAADTSAPTRALAGGPAGG